jgi:hypothetical protein
MLDYHSSDWILTLVPARQGCTVVIPYREEMAKRHLKVTGDLGRVVFIVRFISLRLTYGLFSNSRT